MPKPLQRHKGMVWVVTGSIRTDLRPHHFLYKLPRPYLIVPGIFIGLLTLEYELDSLFWNFGKILPLYAASNPKRAKISFTPPSKPEITHSIAYTICICWWPTESDWPAAYFKQMDSFCWLLFYYQLSQNCLIQAGLAVDGYYFSWTLQKEENHWMTTTASWSQFLVIKLCSQEINP